jgi:hypothetical protein
MTAQGDAPATAWRSPAEAASQLSRLSAEFPAFHIVMETTVGHRVRFVARSRDADVHPRTVITPDVTELRDALTTAPAPPAPPIDDRDQITLTPPREHHLCHSSEHREADRPAEVIVTFGTLADPGSDAFSADALWPDCWGVAYPMCQPCWELTHTVALARRPALTVREIQKNLSRTVQH